MTTQSAAVTSTDREITVVREFDAPRELVWKVWTNPDHIAQWWGPTGFRTTTTRMDVRAGGEWRFTMHGPDGHDYPNHIVYVEVAAPAKLVYKQAGSVDAQPVEFHVTASFDALAPARTRVTLRMAFADKEMMDFVVHKCGALEGAQQTMARLGEYLRNTGRATPEHPPFVLSRVIRAPRDKVYELWTTREHLHAWFGPKGMPIAECTLDLRPGGLFHYCLRSAGGQEMWARWLFREIVPGHRLEFVLSFSDRSGKLARAPFDANWPLEMPTTVTFEDHAGLGRGTTVTIRSEALGSDTERHTFTANHFSMTQGWSGTFDLLDDYLARALTR